MSQVQEQARINAIDQFRDALAKDETLCETFRTAFPEWASNLLDRELSEDDLERVAGGLKYKLERCFVKSWS